MSLGRCPRGCGEPLGLRVSHSLSRNLKLDPCELSGIQCMYRDTKAPKFSGNDMLHVGLGPLEALGWCCEKPLGSTLKVDMAGRSNET